jgi:hypothetical protein
VVAVEEHLTFNMLSLLAVVVVRHTESAVEVLADFLLALLR